MITEAIKGHKFDENRHLLPQNGQLIILACNRPLDLRILTTILKQNLGQKKC